jgi:uncharacterized phosphosugar-binding protein
MSRLFDAFRTEAETRIAALTAEADAGSLDAAIDLLVDCLAAGGVLQAFGTGHSEAFAMEIAGRAGGLIPTNRIALRDVVLRGSRTIEMLGGSGLERDPSVVDELFDLSPIGEHDVFLIASNSGVNGSIVGMALKAKETGHKIIAVTSLEHTDAVPVKHSSGLKLKDIADVVIDNKAPYGDATLELGDTRIGAISSITAAFIAQLLTIGVSERIAGTGQTPPVYLSANIPGGDEHNKALEDLYRDRISRTA